MFHVFQHRRISKKNFQALQSQHFGSQKHKRNHLMESSTELQAFQLALTTQPQFQLSLMHNSTPKKSFKKIVDKKNATHKSAL